jgi:hypothetical protein
VANKFRTLRIDLELEATKQFESTLERINAQLEDNMTASELLKQIYIYGLTHVLEKLGECENENQLC